MMRQTILVTVTAEFIGSCVANALLKLGHCVVPIDNLSFWYPKTAFETGMEEMVKWGYEKTFAE